MKCANENQKRRAKKVAAEDRIEKTKTGGGTYVPMVSTLDEKLLAALGNRAQPLKNDFDSDAAFHSIPGSIVICHFVTF